MREDEITKKGFKKKADNIYENKGVLFVQLKGELVRMDMVDPDTLDEITNGKYKKYLGDNGGGKTSKSSKKPSKKNDELVLATKSDAFDLINQRDDDQVLAEMRGAFLKEFVYSFPTGEGMVTGLSWAGVKEVARRMGHISIDDVVVVEKPDSYQVKAKARDLKRDVTMFGVTEQAKMMTLKNGSEKVDMHALSKCVSRAQRNAIRTLIPEELIKSLINEYRRGK